MNMTARNLTHLFICIALCLVAAAIGGWATSASVNSWYPTLNKPSFNPPAWIFGPVWTALYVMMGVSLWRVWQVTRSAHGEPRAIAPLLVFGIQLALNIAWSFIFFTWRNPGAAVVDIILLWLAIIATIIVFAKFDRLAAWLLVPYALWVTFASVLNIAIWRLNS